MKLFFLTSFAALSLFLNPAYASQEQPDHGLNGFGSSFSQQEHPGFSDPADAGSAAAIEPAAGDEDENEEEPEELAEPETETRNEPPTGPADAIGEPSPSAE